MPPSDEFVHISTSSGGTVSEEFFEHSGAKRIFTEALMTSTIRAQHPKHHLTISDGMLVNYLEFADSRADVTYKLLNPSESLSNKQFVPPARRYNDENGGSFAKRVHFGCYDFVFQGNSFLIYVIEGRDGPQFMNLFNYILVPPSEEDVEMTQEQKEVAQRQADELIEAATRWSQELHNEVLIFDNGWWQKNKELWDNIQKSNWADVILDKEKKEAIIEDVIGFFDSEERYAEFEVPWKRGVIFYGPPGNGKTISTKALMHDISKRTSPNVESLYVKTFQSFMGPEAGIRAIFQKARQMAPCILIFEDIDSLVNIAVRSYFLNEVDGLESNHGILMIASSNHLELLDPGIAKRPSRFDRKYLFDVPNQSERVQYCDYWRHKLRNNKKIDFPEELSEKIAELTDDFSFAYLKEAFVAALLVIVAKKGENEPQSLEDGLKDNVFWNEIKKQIISLRKEMSDEHVQGTVKKDEREPAKETFSWQALSAVLGDRNLTRSDGYNTENWGRVRHM